MNKTEDYLYSLATDQAGGFFPAILKALLFTLSLGYSLLVRVLISLSLFNRRRLQCRVISVGNITLGGTGKTTLVELAAGYLRDKNHKVAIVSRGYKKVTRSPPPKAAGQARHQVTTPNPIADEPEMLEKNLRDVPVIVDADRVRGAKKAIKEYAADTVIFDDGFQQWKIKKDLEIVTIDAANPFGNGRLIPRGIMREPLSSLKRAHIFFLTKTNLAADILPLQDRLKKINPKADIFKADYQPDFFYPLGQKNELIGADAVKDKDALIFCGIGDPASFEKIIADAGVNIRALFRFSDHHNYTQQDLERIIASARERNVDTLITTEKDAVKLNAIRDTQCAIRLLVLRIRLKIIDDEQRFYNRLLSLYSV